MEKQFGEQSGIHQRWWPCLCDFSVGPLSDASSRFFGPCFGCWCQLDRKGDLCGGIRVVFWMGSYWALQMPRFSKLALQNLQNTLIYYTVSKVLAGEKHSQRTERLAHLFGELKLMLRMDLAPHSWQIPGLACGIWGGLLWSHHCYLGRTVSGTKLFVRMVWQPTIISQR